MPLTVHSTTAPPPLALSCSQNLALLDLAEAQAPLPETIEDKLVVGGDAKVVLCAFNRRGNLLAGGCQNGAVVIWDFETHGLVSVLKGHSGCVTSLSWTRSSRMLLSSSVDRKLILWDVLRGVATHTIELEAEITHAALHPRKRLVSLACVASGDAATKAFVVRLGGDEALTAAERCTVLPGAAPDGSEGSTDETTAACFAAQGSLVLVGTAKGTIRCLRTADLSEAFLVRLPGQVAIKSLVVSRDGKSFLCNAADRVIRAYPLERLLQKAAGETIPPRELQDVVNKVQWVHAAFSPGQHDSEHIVGTADAATELLVYIWDMHGHLINILGQGEKVSDGALHFACHPTRPILATCAKSGSVYVWTKRYSENWSAFAPDFKELEENEEYDEKEDEFDIKHFAERDADEDEKDELVDILKEEVTELAHIPDDDDDDAELLCLPTVPEPEAAGGDKSKGGAGGLGAAAGRAPDEESGSDAEQQEQDASQPSKKRKA